VLLQSTPKQPITVGRRGEITSATREGVCASKTASAVSYWPRILLRYKYESDRGKLFVNFAASGVCCRGLQVPISHGSRATYSKIVVTKTTVRLDEEHNKSPVMK